MTIWVILNLRLRHYTSTKPDGKWLSKRPKLLFGRSRIQVTRSMVNENTTDIPKTPDKDVNISPSDDQSNQHNLNQEGKEVADIDVANNEDTIVDGPNAILAGISKTLEKGFIYVRLFNNNCSKRFFSI